MKRGRVGRLSRGMDGRLDGQTDACSGSLPTRAWQAGDPGADPAADPAYPSSLRSADSPWGTAVTLDPVPSTPGFSRHPGQATVPTC